jgi:replicative DNA helicase
MIHRLPIRITDERRLYALEHIAQQHAEQDGRLIVIDQLSIIEVPDADIGYQQATRASNRLRLLARRLRIPILLVAQINRAASRNPKERLTCNDLRDSGALENDAAAVILINRINEPTVKRSPTDPLELELLIGKNRYGRFTRHDDDPLRLLWWPRFCRIEDPGSRLEGGAA